MRDFRSNADTLGRILVPAGGHRQIPISELATIQSEDGPAMIRNENGMLTGYVYIDLANRDPGSYVAEVTRALRDGTKLPAGYSISWGGQSEEIAQANRRLQIIVPMTLAIVVMLILMSTRSLMKTLIVLLAVPFSAIGAVWSIYLLHYNMSVAVWVGVIALLSIDAETGVFMLLYLDLAYEEAKKRGNLRTVADLHRVIRYGAAKRLRPKFMTFATTCIGLFPVMWSIGTGSEVMKRIAAPLVGGIFTSFVLELLVYPAIYELWKRRSVAEIDKQADAGAAENRQHEQELAVAMST
jgi:Cu(I)/Ag(I) efflux system membrane protein CusA/SilA